MQRNSLLIDFVSTGGVCVGLWLSWVMLGTFATPNTLFFLGFIFIGMVTFWRTQRAGFLSMLTSCLTLLWVLHLTSQVQLGLFAIESACLVWLVNTVHTSQIETNENSAEILRLNADLRQRISILQTLFDVIPIGIAVSQDPQCQQMQANPAFAKMLSVSPSENISLSAPKKLRTKSFNILKHGQVVDPNQLPMQQASQLGSPVLNEELEVLKKNGQTLKLLGYAAPIFDELGRVSGSVGAFVDITDRKRMEEELKLSKERFDLVVSITNETVWDCDLVNNTTWRNDGVQSVFGYDQDEVELSWEWWEENIHPEDRERVMKSSSDSLKGNQSSWSEEYRFRRANGTYAYILDRGYVLRDTTGKAVRIVGAMIDISDRKELEKHKDEFISIASHELKTPLTTVKAYTQLVHKKFATLKPEMTLSYLAKIEAQVSSLNRLIDDLLDVSKIAIGQIHYQNKEVSFQTLVLDAIEDFRSLPHHHTVVLEGSGKGKVCADPDRITQVIYNLLNNAIKYSPQADQVIVRVAQDAKQVTCEVQDFGMGIAEAEQQYIFDRFYRINDESRESISGLGIGLYISAEIVHHYQGRIWLKSEEGKGTSFFFSLPLLKKAKRPIHA